MRRSDDKSAETPALRRAVAAAWGALLFERLWRRLTPLLLLACLFASCCWLNIFTLLPLILHGILLALFACALCAALWWLRLLRLPLRAEALARLERDNGLAHDELFLAEQTLPLSAPAATQALWQAHRQRLAQALPRLKSAPPRPNIPLYDKNAARAAVFLLFAVAFFFQFGSDGGRLGDAFYFGAPLTEPLRADAWINPPAYSARPPVTLPLGAEARRGAAQTYAVPQGSVLSVRLNDNGRGLARLACRTDKGALPLRRHYDAASSAYSAILPRSALCVFSAPRAAGGEAQWQIEIAPDKPPALRWLKPPARAVNGLLRLDYDIYAEYGVKQAWLEITPAAPAPSAPFPVFAKVTGAAQVSRFKGGTLRTEQGETISAAESKPAPLFPPPHISLNLPSFAALSPENSDSGGRRGGAAATEADFSQSPWAGAAVTLRLAARDAAGHVGYSAPVQAVLPQKSFVNPLSRALMEQRRLLAQNSNAAPRLAALLDAFLLWPSETLPDKGAALALYSLQARLRAVPQVESAAELQERGGRLKPQQIAAIRAEEAAQRTAGLKDIADYLAAIASGMDGGRLAEAERRLAHAEQALRDALRNGASGEEISRLMQELRAAMQDYLAMLAERGTPPKDAQGKPKMLGDNELERKLKALEDASKNGNRGLGEQLLSEFEDLMKNLQVLQGKGGNGAGGKNSAQSEMQKQLDALSDIMRRQQQLLDDTHKMQEDALRQNHGAEGEKGGQNGQSGRQKQAEELQKRQNELQKDMQALQKQLGQQGLAGGKEQGKDGGKSEGKDGGGLGGAERQMGDAAGALGQGDTGQAMENQSAALQALRDGAQDLMGKMRAALNDAEKARQAEENGQEAGAAGETGGQKDPLGRAAGTGQSGQDSFMPQESAMQRARRILEEIRKRLGNLTPEQEKQYLERLLDFE